MVRAFLRRARNRTARSECRNALTRSRDGAGSYDDRALFLVATLWLAQLQEIIARWPKMIRGTQSRSILRPQTESISPRLPARRDLLIMGARRVEAPVCSWREAERHKLRKQWNAIRHTERLGDPTGAVLSAVKHADRGVLRPLTAANCSLSAIPNLMSSFACCSRS